MRSAAMASMGLILVSILAACSASSGTVKGVVVAVDGTLNDVTSFTVLVEGDEMTFRPTSDGDYVFPLPHLHEHQLSGEPVTVGWRSVDGVLFAISVSDG
jgi:hypothetical protein